MDQPLTEGDAERYASLNMYRLLFQVLLFFSIACSVVYTISLILLGDDLLNAAPQPEALVSDWRQWIFVVPVIGQMIILYSQFAFTMNRRSCMSPMYWVVFVLYIVIYTAAFVYLFYFWLAKCRGVTDLVATPVLSYCSTGTEVRWQFMLTFWMMLIQWVLLIVIAIVLNMIFNIVKRIKFSLADQPVVPNQPLNSVDSRNQIGRGMREYDPLAATVYAELVDRRK
jgi:hypothetical protein